MEEKSNKIPDRVDQPSTVIRTRYRWMQKIMLFLVVFGPGLIVMEADNDAGAVSTYTQAGAQYGLHMLWVLLLLLPITYFSQEMVARLGIATGKGHATMIYRRFGKWWGRFSVFDLQLLNFLTLVTEFAGINLATSQMKLSPDITVPLVAVGTIIMVLTASYRRWESITVFLCLLDIAWIIYAIRLGFSFDKITPAAISFFPSGQGITSSYIFLVIAVVGTTIAPWQLFFQQSCVADKRLRFSDLGYARLDTMIGAIFTIIVAGCMMIVGYMAVHSAIGYVYKNPAQMATSLGAYFGTIVKSGLLLLICNASILGITAVSLSSAWAYAEVMNWPTGLELKPKQAIGFYLIYILGVLAAAGLVLIPKAPLQLIIMTVQVLAGIMLPSSMIFLQLLLNDRELLGNEFVNRPWNNWINWTIIIGLFALSIILAVQVVLPQLFSS